LGISFIKSVLIEFVVCVRCIFTATSFSFHFFFDCRKGKSPSVLE
jgi:hypothetical protein